MSTSNTRDALAPVAAVETLAIDLGHPVAEVQAHLRTETYADSEAAAVAVAGAVGRDLRHLVRAAQMDIAEGLGVPPEAAMDADLLAEVLLGDIERLLRKGLLSQVHLILHDRDLIAPGRLTARYHAPYTLREHQVQVGTAPWNEFASAPPRALTGTSLALCVAWRPLLSYLATRTLAQPEYFFVWTPQPSEFARSPLLRYRFDYAPDAPPLLAHTVLVALRYADDADDADELIPGGLALDVTKRDGSDAAEATEPGEWSAL